MVNTLFLPELREMLGAGNAQEMAEFCTALHPARTARLHGRPKRRRGLAGVGSR